jgi:hypothetical protein
MGVLVRALERRLAEGYIGARRHRLHEAGDERNELVTTYAMVRDSPFPVLSI